MGPGFDGAAGAAGAAVSAAHAFGAGHRGLIAGLLPEAGLCGTQAPRIIPLGSHDTASAVAAMPAELEGACFICCGTWSPMGVVTDAPLSGDAAEAAQISNEVTWDGRFLPLKNIVGLWLVQNCRKAFAKRSGNMITRN